MHRIGICLVGNNGLSVKRDATVDNDVEFWAGASFVLGTTEWKILEPVHEAAKEELWLASDTLVELD
uniref:Uncharacterized protein n=1 Tax=Trichuris muris TaxID=70415 RepID=A0A5S6QHE5_TRIMR